jgi:metallo-beta-lactamase family protein
VRIQFIGATHEVTGSCTLLEVCGKQYLVDCGMEQGKDTFENVPLPVSAGDIQAVFLTHAHIDHSGMLPKLYKEGFRGSIYATEATCDLCDIMLRDSAHIQMSEADWQNRKAQRAGEPLVEPVYDLNDAIGAISCFRRCHYGELIHMGEGIEIRFTDVGHLLGSACIEMWLKEEGQTRKIVFSGDVGNTNQPIIKDPQKVAHTDYLVIESTYGDRLHEKPKDTLEELAQIIKTTLDRGGNLVIPSFAVGRTQEMLYAIRQIHHKGLLPDYPEFPVYVDSPLAVEATGIFLQCDHSCLDEETLALVKEGINPIWFPGVTLSVTSEESKAINFDTRGDSLRQRHVRGGQNPPSPEAQPVEREEYHLVCGLPGRRVSWQKAFAGCPIREAFRRGNCSECKDSGAPRHQRPRRPGRAHCLAGGLPGKASDGICEPRRR